MVIFWGFDLQRLSLRILSDYRPTAFLKYEISRVLPGHHQLSIPGSMIDEIEAAFAQIERNGKLKQGNGLFEFRDFQIQI